MDLWQEGDAPGRRIYRVDLEAKAVYVDRSKNEIKYAPELHESHYDEDAYRAQVGGYYGGI